MIKETPQAYFSSEGSELSDVSMHANSVGTKLEESICFPRRDEEEEKNEYRTLKISTVLVYELFVSNVVRRERM